MVYSGIGKTRLKVLGTLYVANIVVLALSARVNQFLNFFFMADLFPLGLSIATLVLLSIMFILDLTRRNPITSRPPFEIAILSILTIIWLASNVFSTSRWRFVPVACNNIPDGFAAEKEWCRDLQALKAFVWIEWAILFLATIFTVRYAVVQHAKGNTDIWHTALSNYTPRADGGMHRRSSSFFTSFGGNGFVVRDTHRPQTNLAN
ncbi:uncharacterized protein FOMMEDRAFT_116345 [Fomitiporia mediterranea MF3/22]|uniref:uncharacterized protein n=1 Tax=Fomitiporia mediterranea (strain MF3/22) TaxID=694068 RepID=UPI0004407339|nr:uncharacterized protein FOMMEDRAFT_116345 [Fomitiporia mediterranea MF3/22]EJD07912.1 hypothetical protein FOMMEDRAFT_116345 [Fomitiporia mediterranea MF3/22]